MDLFRETIFGYEDLKVNLYYSLATMHIFTEISFKSDISSVDKDLKVGILLLDDVGNSEFANCKTPKFQNVSFCAEK